MREQQVDPTVSNCKEESIRKAVELLQGDGAPLPRLRRPDIDVGKILASFALRLIVLILVGGAVAAAFLHLGLPMWTVVAAEVLIFTVAVALKAKTLICNTVLIYQKYAPERVRRSCLFTPTCSEYMLLAVGKYGVVKGCSKGICRLCRCRHPNGGIDYP